MSKKTNQKPVWLLLLLFLAIGVLYGAHRLVLEGFSLPNDMGFLLFSYTFNLGITLVLTSVIVLLSKKMSDQIGFVFLAGGVLKMGLFLYLVNFFGFNPQKSNFFDFFVPYFGCLIVEILIVTQLLKTPNGNNGKR